MHQARPGGGEQVGEATAAVTPWPHQIRAFDRMYRSWPPKLLIADEVGLAKTIEARLLLRQAWLAGKAKRILILAPKAALKQWQAWRRSSPNRQRPCLNTPRVLPINAEEQSGNEARFRGFRQYRQ